MSGVIRMRVERLGDELKRTREKLADLLAVAEEEKRPLNDFEQEQAAKYRSHIEDFENEIELLAVDIEREDASRDVSALLRQDEDGDVKPVTKRFATPRGANAYGDFTDYIRDWAVLNIPEVASQIMGPKGDLVATRMEAQERIERTLQNTTSTAVAGLIIPTHMTQIMDIISLSRPVVESGADVPLDRGSMTYPKVDTRPEVVEQTSEKTEAGTVAPAISQKTQAAKTYLGAGNISWQAANWSNPDTIAVWFRLAAEAYARQTENRACDVLEDAAIGTVGTASGRLGTAGTESFSAWRAAVAAGIGNVLSNSGGRVVPDTLYLSYNRFIQLATLGTDQVLQMSPVGSADFSSLNGNFMGLRVIGSYGFDQDAAIIGRSDHLFVGENPGSPVELRVVEPRIGGYEIGVIGAFNAAVFDVNSFQHLGTHL